MRPGQDGGWDLTGIDPVRRPSATERLCTDDVAFLDDLGVERATEWTMQQVHRILDDRHADMLPTVVTSNLEPADLKTALGEATYSRLIGSGAIVLRLAGDDRRRRRP
jgi:DNA replication protein DnaC